MIAGGTRPRDPSPDTGARNCARPAAAIRRTARRDVRACQAREPTCVCSLRGFDWHDVQICRHAAEHADSDPARIAQTCAVLLGPVAVAAPKVVPTAHSARRAIGGRSQRSRRPSSPGNGRLYVGIAPIAAQSESVSSDESDERRTGATWSARMRPAVI